MLRTEAPIINFITLHTKVGTESEEVYELKGSLVLFEIFEDLDLENNLFSSSVNLVIRDVDNTLYLKIIGQEMVEFNFESANNESKNEFYNKIYSVSSINKTFDDSNRPILILYLETPYKILGSLMYFSRVLEEVSSEFCLETIFSAIEAGMDSFKKAIYTHNFEDSLFPRNICIPNRTWEWVVNYWIKNSVTSGNDVFSSLFFFWDDKNGLNFKSNRTLLLQDPKIQLYKMNNIASSLISKQIIQKWEVVQEFDTISKLKNGILVPLIFNFTDQTYQEPLYDDTKSETINKVNTVTSTKIEYDLLGKTTKKIFTPIFDNDKFKLLTLEALGKPRTLEQTRLDELMAYTTFVNIEVAGDSSICPGDLIEVLSLDANGEVDKTDLLFWIVKSIKHTVSSDSYIQTIQIMK